MVAIVTTNHPSTAQDDEGESVEAVGDESTSKISLGEVPDCIEGEVPDVTEGEVPDVIEGEVPDVTEGEIPDVTEGEVLNDDANIADSALVPSSWPDSVASCSGMTSLELLPPLLSYDREGEELGRSPPLTQHQLSEHDQVLTL